MSELAQVDTKHSSLFEALAAAQAEFLPVTKNKYYLRSKGGPKIWYAELSEILAAVRPALNRHGIFLFQRVETAQAGVTVETVVAHASGETLSSGKLFMPSNVNNGGVNAAQALGSARTYACRYSLSSFLGISADDDDDGNASGTPGDFTNHEPKRRSEPKPEPKPEGPVLTQQTVDDGHLAAEGGMEGYLAFWNAQTKVTRNLLVNSGWHDVLKKEAMQADKEAAKEKGDSK